MTFVAIAQHTTAQCPGHNREVYDTFSEMMPKLPAIGEQHGVKILGIHLLLSRHKTVIILEAASYEGVEQMMLEAGLIGWNTIDIAQAHPPEEVLKNSPIAKAG